MHRVLQNFINDKNIAIIGASKNRDKWGNMLFRTLASKGYNIYPIHFREEEIEDRKCYKSISALPTNIHTLIISLPPEKTIKLIPEIIASSIKRVWMPTSGGITDKSLHESIQILKRNNICAVYNICPLMIYPSSGLHKIHYYIMKLLNKIPKELCEKH